MVGIRRRDEAGGPGVGGGWVEMWSSLAMKGKGRRRGGKWEEEGGGFRARLQGVLRRARLASSWARVWLPFALRADTASAPESRRSDHRSPLRTAHWRSRLGPRTDHGGRSGPASLEARGGCEAARALLTQTAARGACACTGHGGIPRWLKGGWLVEEHGHSGASLPSDRKNSVLAASAHMGEATTPCGKCPRQPALTAC
jgi:hypothetical protein